jgi:hypothetical protein
MAQISMPFDGMSQRQVRMDSVRVSTAFAFDRQIAAFFQLGDDSLHRTFRDADTKSHIAHSYRGFTGNADQDVTVIA